ncbi:hypothetical protein ACSQ67_020188 [Phaseolus vulgaris]
MSDDTSSEAGSGTAIAIVVVVVIIVKISIFFWVLPECLKRYRANGAGDVGELITCCGIEDKDREIAERIVNVALLCVQHRPEARPIMSVVVKMLEGSFDVPKPPNPFQYLIGWVPPTPDTDTNISTYSSSLVTKSVPVLATHEPSAGTDT